MSERSVEANLSIIRGYTREFSEHHYTDQLRIIDEMHDLLDDIEDEVSADV